MAVIVTSGRASRVAVEFQVESNPADRGRGPSVTGLADGRFLVTWEGLLGGSDDGDDSNYSDIIGRAFGADARASGGDFLVNSVTQDGQRGIASARVGNGYVVAYSSGDENQLDGTYAASRIVGADGSPTGGERFNRYSNYNDNVAVAGIAGGYVVTSTQEYTFEAQVRASDGAILADFDFGGADYGDASTVTALASGGYQLFWTGYQTDQFGVDDTTLVRGIYAQRGGTDGLRGEAVLIAREGGTDDAATAAAFARGSIATATLADGDIVVGGLVFDPDRQAVIGGQSRDGAVASLDDGGFVLVTEARGDGQDIFAQLFDADGTSRGDRFLVNQQTAGDQTRATVAAIGGDGFVVAWEGPDGVKATTFSALGTAVDPSILVDITSANDQADSAVTRLAGGGFVVVWRDDSRIESTLRADIRGQVFDAAGGKLGGEFLVNTSRADADVMPDVTADPDGGFTVGWQHGQDESFPSYTTAFQRFTAAGAKTGGEILLPSATFLTDPRIATIGGGRTALVYNDRSSDRLVGRIYTQAGVNAASFAIALNGGGRGFDIAGLAGGGFAIAYAPSSDPDETPQQVHVAAYAATGALLYDRAIDGTTGGSGQPAVAALAGNGYVVTWIDGGDAFAQVYRSDGTAVNGAIAVEQGVSAVDVAALADGRFVVTTSNPGASATRLASQVFTVEGDRSGALQNFTVAGTTAPEAAVAGRGDHGFVVTYDGFGDGSGTAVRARTFEAADLIRGSGGSEVLAGTDAADTLYALGGNDRVFARGGDDLVYGGNGTDVIDGGDGSDTIYGQLQIDRLDGDAGDDTLIGDTREIARGQKAAGDTLDGGTGADTLFGDAYTIRAGGTGGRDTLTGGDGDDTLYGDAYTLENGATGGADVLSGGAGDDTLYGDAVVSSGGAGGNDSLDGGTGDDRLFGGGGDDTFLFRTADFGNDTIGDFGQTPGDRDRIDLRGLVGSFADLVLTASDGGISVYADQFGTDSTIFVRNVDQLTAADFRFG